MPDCVVTRLRTVILSCRTIYCPTFKSCSLDGPPTLGLPVEIRGCQLFRGLYGSGFVFDSVFISTSGQRRMPNKAMANRGMAFPVRDVWKVPLDNGYNATSIPCKVVSIHGTKRHDYSLNLEHSDFTIMYLHGITCFTFENITMFRIAVE